jgi:DNA repair protein RadC
MRAPPAVNDVAQADLWTRPPAEPAPHHHGHRERLRARAARGGLGALPDYELLELHLFRSIPRGDVKPLAKALIARFGSLGAVLGASLEALRTVPGVGEAVALDLRLAHETSLRLTREQVAARPVISSWTALLDYVRTALAHEPREQVRVLFLDKKNQLIADEVMNHGTVDHAPVYPREVARRALELSASAVILVHNHPSGDPSPSSADVDMTRQVVQAARSLQIAVHDHLVVGRDGIASLKALGLM